MAAKQRQRQKIYSKNAQTDDTVTIDGTSYTIKGTTDADKNEYKVDELKTLVKDGSTVEYKGKSVTAINDQNNDNVDDTDSSVITAAHAIDLMNAELLAANNIGNC